MLKFDAETTALLERAYVGTDFADRRRFSLAALDPRPGETILDLGCGNGLQTADLARAVGPEGTVIGVDPSADMRAAAETRCRDFSHVRFAAGAADGMPLDAGSVDRAVSLQVFEYLPDLDAAVAEVKRVLRPGGRLVVGDIHWDTWVWHAEDAALMGRMMASWNRHVSERAIPAALPAVLRAHGFEIDSVRPLPVSDTVLRADGLAWMMLRLMPAYALTNDHVSAEETRRWRAEQERLAREGRFFFCINHFVIVARRP